MSYDLFLRRRLPRDFSRGDEIALERSNLHRLAIVGLGLASALAVAYPEIKRVRERKHYLREFTDDPQITQRLPAISDAMIMNHHKTKLASKKQREQKQARQDLEHERQQYRQSFSKDRAITQEIPVVPMYNLIREGRP
jgi:hypothetical protein